MPVGELVYKRWYSFDADLTLFSGVQYQFVSKGFWNSRIELSNRQELMLQFSMGWKGIVITTYFDGSEQHFLLKPKGVFSNKFVLLDDKDAEMLVLHTDFKWSKLNFDFQIDTTQESERSPHRYVMMLTVLHCINYYLTTIVAAA